MLPIAGLFICVGVLNTYYFNAQQVQLMNRWRETEGLALEEKLQELVLGLGAPARSQEILVQGLFKQALNSADAQALLSDLDWLRIHLFWQMRAFPDLDAVFFGAQSREFVGYARFGERLELMISGRRTNYGIEFYTVDENGAPLELLRQRDDFPVNSRVWYLAAKDKNQSVWGDVFTYHAAPIMALPSSASIRHAGRLLGVSGNNIFLNRLSAQLEALKQHPGDRLVIVDALGFLVGDSDRKQPFVIEGERTQRIAYAASDRVSSPALLEDSPFWDWLSVLKHFSATSHFSFTVSLPGAPPWQVHVRRVNAEIIARIQKNFKFFFLSHVVGVGVLFLVMFLVYRMLLKPVKQASITAQQIAQGDLTQRLSYSGSDELGALSAAFNQMLSWLVKMVEGSHQDQAVLAEANKALEQKTEYLVKLQETVADGYFEWRASNRSLRLSPKLHLLFGGEVKHRLVQERWRAFMAPEALDRFFENFYAFCEGRQKGAFMITVACIDSNSRRLWVQVRAGIAEYDAQGRAEFVVGSMEDVTQTHLQREELEVLHERTQLAAEASGSGVWDWNLLNGDMYWDQRMGVLYGEKIGAPRETYGRWVSLIHIDDREGFVAALSQAIRTLTSLDYSFRIVTAAGQEKSMRVLGKVLLDNQSMPHRFVGMSWDMGDLQLRMGDVHLASRRLSEWAADLSCRVKARLVALSGCAGYLQQDIALRNQVGMVEGIARLQEHLAQLMLDVQDMLDGSRAQLESGVTRIALKRLFAQLCAAWRQAGVMVQTVIAPSAQGGMMLPQARLKQLLAQMVALCVLPGQPFEAQEGALVLHAHCRDDALVLVLRVSRPISLDGRMQAQFMRLTQGSHSFDAQLQVKLEHDATLLEVTVPLVARSNAPLMQMPEQRSA